MLNYFPSKIGAHFSQCVNEYSFSQLWGTTCPKKYCCSKTTMFFTFFPPKFWIFSLKIWGTFFVTQKRPPFLTTIRHHMPQAIFLHWNDNVLFLQPKFEFFSLQNRCTFFHEVQKRAFFPAKILNFFPSNLGHFFFFTWKCVSFFTMTTHSRPQAVFFPQNDNFFPCQKFEFFPPKLGYVFCGVQTCTIFHNY